MSQFPPASVLEMKHAVMQQQHHLTRIVPVTPPSSSSSASSSSSHGRDNPFMLISNIDDILAGMEPDSNDDEDDDLDLASTKGATANLKHLGGNPRPTLFKPSVLGGGGDKSSLVSSSSGRHVAFHVQA